MADGTPTGETVDNNSGKGAQNSAEQEELKRVQKELDQMKMRNNQLENERKKREEAEEKAKQQELEENSRFNELYENERKKREELEAKLSAEEQQKNIHDKKAELLKEFPEEVKKFAEETGITLQGTDDDAVNEYKTKIEKIDKTLRGKSRVTRDNPSVHGSEEGQTGMSKTELRTALRDPKKFEEIAAKYPGIAAQMPTKRQ